MTLSKTLRLALATAFVGAFAVSSLAQGGGIQGPPAGGPGQGPPQGFGQGPGPGGPGGMQMRRGGNSGMMLLQMKSVQKELNMTADQIEKLNSLRPPMGGPGGPGGPPPPGGQGGGQRGPGNPPQGGQGGGFQGPPQGGPPQQGGQRGPGGQGGFQGGPPQGGFGPGGPQGPNPNDQLAKILNEKQMDRLNQLMVQFNAPMSMLDPKNGKELNLSEEQRQSLDKIIRENMPQMGRGPGGQGGPGGPPPQGGQGRGPGGQGGQGGPPQGPPQGGGQGGGFQGPPQGGAQRGPGGQGGFQGGPPQGGGQGFQRGPMIPWSEMQAKKAAATKAALKVLNGEQLATWNKLTGAEFTKWEEPKRPQD